MNTTTKQRNALMLCLVLLLGLWFAPVGWAEDTPPFRVPPEIVSAGFINACGIKSDSTVACWGDNFYGEATPPPVTFTQISAGRRYACGVRSNGTLSCWGAGGFGQNVPPAGTFTQVSAGEYHTCGVRSNGTVACWGGPRPPAGIFTQVSASYEHDCGVKSDGTVACWGETGSGAATPPAGTFTQVSAGGYHTCGVRSDGTIACWGGGRNLYGAATPPAGTFVQVDAGLYHTCGVKSDGTVACWGQNFYGEATPPAGTFIQVSAGAAYTCGLRSDSTVTCWGSNAYGRATPPAGTFGITTYTLTVIATGSGTGTVTSAPTGINCGSDCGETYGSSTVVTLTATPASGSTFTGWSGACSGAGACQITMDQDRAVTATFNDRASLIVVKTGSGSGRVTSNPAGIDCGNDCSENYPINTLVRLTATPAAGFRFTGWSGACSDTSACQVRMTQARSVIATFAIPNYALAVRKTGNGSGTVTSRPAGINCGSDCNQSYASGKVVTLTAKPSSNAVFVGWSGACRGTAASCTVTMTQARTVTAAFVKKGYYLLTVSKAGSGSGTVTSSLPGINCGSDCDHTYRRSTKVTLTARARSGSVFAGWKGACTHRLSTCQVTLNGTRTVTATFNRRSAASYYDWQEFLNPPGGPGDDDSATDPFPWDRQP